MCLAVPVRVAELRGDDAAMVDLGAAWPPPPEGN